MRSGTTKNTNQQNCRPAPKPSPLPVRVLLSMDRASDVPRQGRRRPGTTRKNLYGANQNGVQTGNTSDVTTRPATAAVVRTKSRRLEKPPLHCSICEIGLECPEYHEGYVCAFTPQFANVNTRSMEGIIDHLAQIFEDNILRLRRARLAEEILLGGRADRKTTRLSTLCMRQAAQLVEYMRALESTSVVASGEGILSQIFGHLIKGHDIVLSRK